MNKFLSIGLDDGISLEKFELKLGNIKEQIARENGYDVMVYFYYDDNNNYICDEEFRVEYKVKPTKKYKKSDDMKILERLQKRMKDDPNAVHKILVSANIIDEDGNLTEHYRGDTNG